MRFIDANVFIHAYIKPKRRLQEHEEKIKEEAKAIVARVNRGEEVATTVVHIGEIANLLEDFTPLNTALRIVMSLLLKGNIHIAPITRQDYLSALPKAQEAQVGLNDALAYTLMIQKGIQEIYSFDKDFDKLEKTTRVTEQTTRNP